MNKWIILFATVLMAFATAYAAPTTYKNPIMSNLVINGLLALFTIIGFWLFIRSGNRKAKTENVSVQGQTFTPIE